MPKSKGRTDIDTSKKNVADIDERRRAFVKSSSLANFRQTQACDRCRLKKIKCDGARPSCSNCAKINFVCKVSDKLVRRGFPRGYTEALEKEVIRLQNLLNNATKALESVPHSSPNSFNQPLQFETQKVQQTQTQTQTQTQPSASQSGVNTSFQDGTSKFSFINDNFYRFNNYLFRNHANTRQVFLGHRTWTSAASVQRTGTDSVSELDQRFTERDPMLREIQFNLLIGSLKLDPQFLYPQFLNLLYRNNYVLIKNLIKASIADFFTYQNSLIPLLYPRELWESKLIDLVDSGFLTDRDPVTLLALLYIIQISWCGIDDGKLFELTKLVLTEANITTLQVVNLASYYFMGSCLELGSSVNSNENRNQNVERNNYDFTDSGDDVNRLQDNKAATLWSTELLNLAYSKVLIMGIYINSNNLVVLTGNPTSEEAEAPDPSAREKYSVIETVTLWCFQFLYTWWSFIQGLPKINFLIDEFQPRSVESLNIPSLKSFYTLLTLVVTYLDGCNLIKTLTDPENSKLIYTIESFGHTLRDNKLFYSSYGNHDVMSSEINESEVYGAHSVDAVPLRDTDIVEIQLTLFYLILSLLAIGQIDQQRLQTQRMNSYLNLTHSIEEISYEILNLYYLLIISDDETSSHELLNSKNGGVQYLATPRLFRVLHVLPIQNSTVIRSCLRNLTTWGSSNGEWAQNDKNGLFWQYTKYRSFLVRWIEITYSEHPLSGLPGRANNDVIEACGISDLIGGICQAFNIDISRLRPTRLNQVYHQDPVTYMKQIVMLSAGATRTPGLTRPGSRVTMDQFNVFTSSNTNLFSQFKNLVTPKMSDVNRGIFSPIEESRKESTAAPITRDNNNDYNSNTNTNNNLGFLAPVPPYHPYPNPVLAPMTTQPPNPPFSGGGNGSKGGELSHMSLSTLFLLSPLLDKRQEDIDDGYVEEDEDDNDNLKPLAFHFDHLKNGFRSGQITSRERQLNPQPILEQVQEQEEKKQPQQQQHELTHQLPVSVPSQSAPTHTLQKFNESERKRPTLENIVLNEEDPVSRKRSKTIQNSTTNKINQILSG